MDDVERVEDVNRLNAWIRQGRLKSKLGDKALLNIITSNATIMSSIMATVANVEKVFTLKGYPVKIKLAVGTIYCHETKHWHRKNIIVFRKNIIVFTGKRSKSLVFSWSYDKLMDCNINNIFALPTLNEEMEAIIGLHEDRVQIETEERSNVVDGFREYVKAIGDMLKSN